MKLKLYLIAYLACCCACQSKPKTPSNKTSHATAQQHNFLSYKSKIGNLSSYDGNRLLETETAFFVDSNLIVARLSAIIEATHVEIKTWNGETYSCNSFIAIDRTNNIVILKSNKSNPSGGIVLQKKLLHKECPVKCPSEPKHKLMSVKTGNIYPAKNTNGALNYPSTLTIYEKNYGSPIFHNDSCIGIGFSDIVDYEKTGLIIPSCLITELLKNQTRTARPFSELKSKSSQANSIANSKIKGLRIETSLGDITIRLFNETPEYRDNFIALVREHYYDSLLIHRVIPGFCIQSGAADTRYAQANDVVGWRGPGYTLPAHIVPGKFHKRGTIGSPRKPDSVNEKLRSDGSQFYIVTGRKYSDIELDLISKDTGYKFSKEQREYYKTVGGAPHIDGSYTIFGEVTSGLDIADKINAQEVDASYRPKQNIRIYRIQIIP